MLFNSPTYLVFFVAVFCLYWAVRRRVAQNVLLLVAGYVFYGTWSWKFLLLLWFSTLLDYTCGRLIGSAPTQARRRAVLIASAIINLGLLAVFKYLGFFVQQAAELLQALGLQPHFPVLQVVLPVGISFYTFQSLSYVIDTYRGKVQPERNLLDYAVYVAFFPQLVAGPIERATRLLPQLKQPRVFSGAAVESGVQLMVWGIFKKVVIADNLSPYVDAVFGHPGGYSPLTLFTATVFFAFQIYCDFSGYSDTARGTARTLGIELMVNFDLPYFSRTPVEFWRRWHISLSQWFQDYLYYPLALYYVRKGGWGSKYRAHLISMGLIGLWHGASWTFVVFGLYWGLAIAGYLYLSERYEGLPENHALVRLGESAWLARWQPLLSTVGMFAIACIGWILFRAKTLGDFWTVLSGMIVPVGHESLLRLEVLDVRLLWALVLSLWATELIYRNGPRLVAAATGGAFRRLAWRYAMVCTIVLSYVAAQHGHAQPFIYFQF
jgi:alginate O-acetyltransferase complex protein AlgI